MFPFEEVVELGAANAGETIGGTENSATGRVTDDDDPALFACRQFETVGSKAGSEAVAIGAACPSGANVLACLCQIETMAFPGLMSLGGIRSDRLWPVTKRVG